MHYFFLYRLQITIIFCIFLVRLYIFFVLFVGIMDQNSWIFCFGTYFCSSHFIAKRCLTFFWRPSTSMFSSILMIIATSATSFGNLNNTSTIYLCNLTYNDAFFSKFVHLRCRFHLGIKIEHIGLKRRCVLHVHQILSLTQ